MSVYTLTGVILERVRLLARQHIDTVGCSSRNCKKFHISNRLFNNCCQEHVHCGSASCFAVVEEERAR